MSSLYRTAVYFPGMTWVERRRLLDITVIGPDQEISWLLASSALSEGDFDAASRWNAMHSLDKVGQIVPSRFDCVCALFDDHVYAAVSVTDFPSMFERIRAFGREIGLPPVAERALVFTPF